MTKQMKSPKKALPYKKLLDYFRDEPNYMGKGAKGRILEKAEMIEQKGMGLGGPDDEFEESKERKRKAITPK